MKKQLLISLLIGALPLGMAAQDDDLYFVSKKKSVEKVADDYGLPRDTYYSGSNRDVDEYNRRWSHYEQIDSTMADVIDFNGEKGGFLRVRTELLNCDLYRFLKNDPEAVNAYRGEYMEEYPWAIFNSASLAERE